MSAPSVCEHLALPYVGGGQLLGPPAPGGNHFRRMTIAMPEEVCAQLEAVPHLISAIKELHARLKQIEEKQILVDGTLVPLVELIAASNKLPLVLQGIDG